MSWLHFTALFLLPTTLGALLVARETIASFICVIYNCSSTWNTWNFYLCSNLAVGHPQSTHLASYPLYVPCFRYSSQVRQPLDIRRTEHSSRNLLTFGSIIDLGL